MMNRAIEITENFAVIGLLVAGSALLRLTAWRHEEWRQA